MSDPILIVGAGPVGLMSALWFTRLGQPVRIVDKKGGGSTRSKALGLHAASLELLDRLGVADRFLAAGRPVRKVAMFSDGTDPLVELSFEGIDSPYDFILVIEQAESERLLREAIAEADVEVEWETEVTGVMQTEETCIVHYADGTASTHPWVVGCDGGPSTIRDSLEIAFEGEKVGTWFVLADARVDWEEPFGEVRGFLTADGPLLFIPLAKAPYYRLVCPLLEADPAVEPRLSDERFVELARERCQFPCELSDFRWKSSFQVRRRLAERYRSGRVFLAGDAAHTHSPIGGQGMNTGLADASNLCWKIDAVERGNAPEEFLDTYEYERRPVARAILFSTRVATSAATSGSTVAQQLRNYAMQIGASFRLVREEAARRASMTEFVYSGPQFGHAPVRIRDTELVTHVESERPSVAQRLEFSRAPHPGSRAPEVAIDDGHHLLQGGGTRHILLLFDGLGATEEGYRRFESGCKRLADVFGELILPVVVTPDDVPESLGEVATIVRDPELRAHQRYGASSEAGYLVRPDNYVAWRGQPMDFDALFDFL